MRRLWLIFFLLVFVLAPLGIGQAERSVDPVTQAMDLLEKMTPEESEQMIELSAKMHNLNQ